MKKPRLFICERMVLGIVFSTEKGGGPLELIQEIIQADIYKAGKWALDNGICMLPENESPLKQTTEPERTKRPPENRRSEKGKQE